MGEPRGTPPCVLPMVRTRACVYVLSVCVCVCVVGYTSHNVLHISSLNQWFQSYNFFSVKKVKSTHKDVEYRSGTVNLKSFIGKDFLQIKWKFELYITL